MKKTNILTQGPIVSTLIKLSLQMLIGMLSMVALNLTDTYFVGKIGLNELAALSYTFPVIMFINSMALGLGIGVSAMVSKALGTKDTNEVKNITTYSIILAIITAIFLIFIGIATISPLFNLLGAKGDILHLINTYMRIWYFGIIFVFVPMVGNNAIRATGDMKSPSLLMFLAVMVNIILDPIMIFGLGPIPAMGITGAAIATVIARAAALLIAIYLLHNKYQMIRVELPVIKEMIFYWKKVLFVAIPAAATRIIIPLSASVVTRLISKYGHEAVAGYGISTRVEFFALSFFMALSTVIMPFVGQNLGSKNITRIKEGIKYCNLIIIVWSMIICIFLFAFARPIASTFSDEILTINTAVLYLRIIPLCYAFYGITSISNAILNALHKPIQAASLTVIQIIILHIPLSIMGSYILGIKGIYSAHVIANILAAIIAITITRSMLKKIDQ